MPDGCLAAVIAYVPGADRKALRRANRRLWRTTAQGAGVVVCVSTLLRLRRPVPVPAWADAAAAVVQLRLPHAADARREALARSIGALRAVFPRREGTEDCMLGPGFEFYNSGAGAALALGVWPGARVWARVTTFDHPRFRSGTTVVRVRDEWQQVGGPPAAGCPVLQDCRVTLSGTARPDRLVDALPDSSAFHLIPAQLLAEGRRVRKLLVTEAAAHAALWRLLRGLDRTCTHGVGLVVFDSSDTRPFRVEDAQVRAVHALVINARGLPEPDAVFSVFPRLRRVALMEKGADPAPAVLLRLAADDRLLRLDAPCRILHQLLGVVGDRAGRLDIRVNIWSDQDRAAWKRVARCGQLDVVPGARVSPCVPPPDDG